MNNAPILPGAAGRALVVPAAAALCWGLAVRAAFAGPPFLTDDPEPVPYRHWEIYAFASRDRTRSTDTVQGLALEVNNGVAPDTQFHLVIPETFFSQDDASARGLGDIEAGVKYRFLDQTKTRPEIGTFPQAELPSGDPSKGLGNGRAWFKAPLWIQKDWFTPDFSLLFSGGHSFQGDGNSVLYIGLYRTFGPGAP